MRLSLLVALLSLPIPFAVHAADQTVLGNSLLVSNPGPPDHRVVVVRAKERNTDNTIVGDPTVTGITVRIRANGDNPSEETYLLGAGNSPATGRPYWTGNAARGYVYRDVQGAQGPVKRVQIKRSARGVFAIRIAIDARGGAVMVVPPNQGTDGCVLVSILGGDTYSVRFASGSITNKGASQFRVVKPTAEGTCVTTTTTTTTTTVTSTSTTTTTLVFPCGNGEIDAGEQCDTPGTSCGGTAVCQNDCTCPCDFLDQADCLFPFPSDYLTKVDATTDTGRRIHFGVPTLPSNNNGVKAPPTDYNYNDGFSPGSTILLHVPGVNLAQTGAAPITDIERSLDADTPVVIVNTNTLAHHLSFVELDANASSDATRAMIIHPAVNFDEGTRYIVALRQMKDAGGAIIPPAADFLAYRDNTPTGDPVKEARRPHMEDLFTTLAAAGVPRNDLYLAWDFTVASSRSMTERLLSMRDDAFDRLDSASPAFTVSTVETDLDSRIFRRVTGTFQVERYVNATTAPARFVLDANGLPTHQATPQPASFVCIIPRAALANATATAVPARASIYGHGLLGSNTEVASGNVRDMANEHNFVFCATKWIGMADEDVGNAISILQNVAGFPSLTDRLQQAMVNQLFLARLMIHPNGLITHPAFQDQSGNPVIDTSNVFYDGNSQGGIFGGTVMAVAQDITRGVLGVPGMNYSLLLTRSTDFALYSAILNPSYPNELHRPLVLALIQMLWDRSDPNGYARHIKNDPLPNTPSHDVLLHLAFGDHQVANVATEVEARTIGLSIHQPAIAAGRHSDVNPYFGIPAIPSDPFNGSALIVWDSGAATPPITNVAPGTGADPHSDPRNSSVARTQKSYFLQAGGSVVDVCGGAPCVAP